MKNRDASPFAQPRIIAWEVTRQCNLNCKHCRAAARNIPYENEFTTEQCFRLLENIAAFARPIIILTGGEPMLRADIYDIARHGHELGLRMVMAPCGVLVDDAAVKKMLAAGIQCISISIDGATAESHDGFRCVSGAFDTALQAIAAARRNNLPFQINTTITRHNSDELPGIMKLAEQVGAMTFNPFLLVPTGRGKDLADQEISPEQYEQTLQWLNRQRSVTPMQVRVTCAPHYQRIVRQNPVPSASETGHGSPAGGCLGGKSFAFISHTGKVQICGFLELEAGDLAQNDLNFEAIWKNSSLFQQIRDVDRYRGKCGYCEYRRLCGGCRARACAVTGDFLSEEPFCVYQPDREKSGKES